MFNRSVAYSLRDYQALRHFTAISGNNALIMNWEEEVKEGHRQYHGRGRGQRGRGRGSYRGQRSYSNWGDRPDSGRGGGRGRGGHRNRHRDNAESGATGHQRERPPPGLSGREIGMWYARRSKANTEKNDKDNRSFVHLDKSKERHLSGLLTSIRHAEACPPQPDRYKEDWFDGEPSSSSATPRDSPRESTSSNNDGSDAMWSQARQNQPDSEQAMEGLVDQEILDEMDVPMLYPAEQDEETSDSRFMYEFQRHRKENRLGPDRHQDFDQLRPLYKDPSFDEEQYQYLHEMQTSSKYQNMLSFRQKLPSYNMREELVEKINSSQVTVISGATGCGKTTQVAQFLLDDAIENKQASLCRIVCTQPRRISAISVAERVAVERGERCGQKTVGYQIRLEKREPSTRGSILYCTTGIVLQWLANNPLLRGTSHLILDEIHERDLHSDFLMIIMRDLLPKRPDVKVVLMSATLNAEMFSQYYGNCPMLSIPGFTFPVTSYLLEDVIEQTRYRPTKQPQRRRMFRGKAKYEEMAKQEEYQSWCDTLRQSNSYSDSTISTLRDMSFDEVDVDLAANLTEQIMRHKPDGAILIFLPGWGEISKVHKMLTSNPLFSSNNSRILPLHSLMPTVNQREVFERPPPGVRKIILATNIAETSITIDDVVYVIDCGRIRLKNYDAEKNLSTLDTEFVSKANARQRRGRAGRVQAGECYHLFTQYHLDGLQDYQLPEILRTSLEELCLTIKLLRLGRIEPFVQKAMQPPSLEALHAAITTLRDLNALDDNEDLTPLGYHLAKMPIDPHSGKMLLFGAMFSCLDPILSVAASLSYKDAFVIPMGKEALADKRRKEISKGSQSDHIMLANAFSGYERALSRGTHGQYCYDNFLSRNVLKLLQDMRKQFTKVLYDMKFISSHDPKAMESNRNSDKEAVVKAVICAGLYPHVAKVVAPRKKHGRAPAKLFTKDEKVAFHMRSVNEGESDPMSQYCVYFLKLKTAKIYLHDSTMVSPLSLLFFGGHVNIGENSQDGCVVSVDEWIKVNSTRRVATLVTELRREIDKLLEYKITHPGPTDWNPGSKEGALMRGIIDLINTEELKTVAKFKGRD